MHGCGFSWVWDGEVECVGVLDEILIISCICI